MSKIPADVADLLRLCLSYLEHPDVAAIPFAVRPLVVAHKIRIALDPAPVSAAMDGHILNIASLTPVHADCSCGRWAIKGSAWVTRDEIERRWSEHLFSPSRVMNQYRHCGQEWDDVWSCACNDKCPICNKEIEPYNSVEVEA